MVILSPQTLNNFKTFFFILSVSRPNKPFNIDRPSSLYNPARQCSKIWWKIEVGVKYSYQLIHILLCHRSNPSEVYLEDGVR